MLVRKPIPINIKTSDYNNNNLYEYSPYLMREGELIIDVEWWESLSVISRQMIIKNTNNKFTLGEVDIPHVPQEHKSLTLIYQSYLDSFDYDMWYDLNISNVPKNVKLIKMTDEVKQAFLFRDDNILNDFKSLIDKNIEPNVSYFVRLSSTSGKNEKSVEPLDNADAIIKRLKCIDLFRKREFNKKKDTYLILIPWNNDIVDGNEFRIFVVNNKLTAASPQRWWELYQYSQEELDVIENALNFIEFIDDVPYSTFIADVYINMKDEKCHLIEINPFGAHSGAGSSLFNWIDDYDLLHGKTQSPELRYLSLISY